MKQPSEKHTYYLFFPILQTVSAEFKMKSQTASGKSKKGYTLCSELKSKQKEQLFSIQSEISHTLCAQFPFSWSHYCLLFRLDDPFKREFYEESFKNRDRT